MGPAELVRQLLQRPRREGQLAATGHRCDGNDSPRLRHRSHFILLATTTVHQGGGLAARTLGVLTMHATSRFTGVGATDSRNRRDPTGLRGKVDGWAATCWVSR